MVAHRAPRATVRPRARCDPRHRGRDPHRALAAAWLVRLRRAMAAGRVHGRVGTRGSRDARLAVGLDASVPAQAPCVRPRERLGTVRRVARRCHPPPPPLHPPPPTPPPPPP